MNIKRRIQLTAAAVIANGAVALAMMSPTPTLAAACADIGFCWSATFCPSLHKALCNAKLPAGCVLASSSCVYPAPSFPCTYPTYGLVICNFEPA